MSSRLQLDMRNLSLERRHLVNAYEVEAGIGVIAGNTVIHAWAPWVWGATKSALYKYTYLLPLLVACSAQVRHTPHMSCVTTDVHFKHSSFSVIYCEAHCVEL